MAKEPDIFGYLATTQISGITTALLDSSTKNTYANQSNVQFWKGPISIWRVVEATRTYPHGIGVPEQGKVAASAAASSGSVQPTGTQVFKVQAISFDNAGVSNATVSVKMDSGAGTATIETLTVPATDSASVKVYFPIELNNSLYLSWSSDENVSAFIAYQTVGV